MSVAATSQESGHAEPAPIEPVEIDLGNAPMPYDMDAPQIKTCRFSCVRASKPALGGPDWGYPPGPAALFPAFHLIRENINFYI